MNMGGGGISGPITGGSIEAGGRTTDPVVPTEDTTRSIKASTWEGFEITGAPLPGESQGGIYDSDKSNIILENPTTVDTHLRSIPG